MDQTFNEVTARAFMAGDSVSFADDFNRKALDSTNLYTVTVEADATAPSTVAISSSVVNGAALLTLGAVANDFANLATPLHFSSGKAGVLQVVYKVSGSPDNLAIGWSDALTESNGNLSTNITTPTILPTDFAGFIYEKANGGDYWYVATTKNNVDTVVKTTKTVSTSYQTLRIEVYENLSVGFFVDGILVHITDKDAVRADIGMCAIVASTNVAGTITPVITVDKFEGYRLRA